MLQKISEVANSGYKNKVFIVIKSIERLVSDAIERDIYHYDDMAQMKSEICGISRRQIFNINKNLAQL